MKKLFWLFIFLYLIIFTNKIHAFENFNEEFDGDFTYKLSWIPDNYLENYDVLFSQYPGKITLNTDNIHFPFIHTKSTESVFPSTSNFSVEFSFEYLVTPSILGTGIVVSDNIPLVNTAPLSSNSMFQVWKDLGNGLNFNTTIEPRENYSLEKVGDFYFILKNTPNSYSNHIVKIEYKNNHYYYYINNILKYESIDTNRKPIGIWMGNPKVITPPSGDWSDFSVDYIRIKQLPDKDLNVPFFSQNDTLWASDTYDHLDDTIDNKGCALTSAAMLLAYHGIDITPNNDPMNPKTLNEWLINKIPQEGLMGNAKGYTGDGGISWIAVNQLARYFRPFLTFQMMKGDLQAENDIFGNFNTSINNNSPEILWVSGNGTYWSNWGTHFIVGRGYDSNGIYINDPEEMYNYIPADYPVKQRLAFIDDAEWEDWGIINIHYPNAISLVVEDADGRKLGEDKSGNSYNQIPHGHFLEGNVYGGSFSDTANNIYLYKVANPTTYKLWVESNENVNFNLEMHSLNTDNSAFTNTISNAINNIDTQQYSILFANNQNNTISLIPNPDPDPDPSDLFKALEEYVKNAYDQGKIKSKTYRNLLLLKVDLAQWLYNRGNLRACEAMLDFIEKSVAKSHKNQIDQPTANEIIVLVQEIKESLGL